MPTFSTFSRALAQFDARLPHEAPVCRVCDSDLEEGECRMCSEPEPVDEEAEADAALAERIAADILAGLNLEVWCGKGAPPEGEAAIREYAQWAAVNL